MTCDLPKVPFPPTHPSYQSCLCSHHSNTGTLWLVTRPRDTEMLCYPSERWLCECYCIVSVRRAGPLWMNEEMFYATAHKHNNLVWDQKTITKNTMFVSMLLNKKCSTRLSFRKLHRMESASCFSWSQHLQEVTLMTLSLRFIRSSLIYSGQSLLSSSLSVQPSIPISMSLALSSLLSTVCVCVCACYNWGSNGNALTQQQQRRQPVETKAGWFIAPYWEHKSHLQRRAFKRPASWQHLPFINDWAEPPTEPETTKLTHSPSNSSFVFTSLSPSRRLISIFLSLSVSHVTPSPSPASLCFCLVRLLLLLSIVLPPYLPPPWPPFSLFAGHGGTHSASVHVCGVNR